MRTIFTFFCLVVAFGCHKEYDGPTIIQGTITEKGTDKPVEKATVLATALLSSGVPGFPDYMAIDSVLTDKDGKYKIIIENDEDLRIISLFVRKDGYSLKSNIGALPKKINDINVAIEPLGWLRLFVKNETKKYVYGRVGSGFGGNSLSDFSGLDIDTTVVHGGICNKDISVRVYGSNDYSNWTSVLDVKVYCAGLDTTNFSISY